MTLADAIEADRKGQIEKAAREYESVLTRDITDLVATMNLIVLYWQSTDYGFSLAHQLPPSFVAKAGTRLTNLVETARLQFSGRPEVRFWAKYIAWADRSDSFEPVECRNLLRLYPDYLEPAMLLFAVSRGTEASAIAHELLTRCRADGTTRARYVSSVIEGVLKRQRSKKQKSGSLRHEHQ